VNCEAVQKQDVISGFSSFRTFVTHEERFNFLSYDEKDFKCL